MYSPEKDWVDSVDAMMLNKRIKINSFFSLISFWRMYSPEKDWVDSVDAVMMLN